MSVYSITFSPTGGTQSVMDALCAKLGPTIPIDLTNRETDFSRWHFTCEDLCLVAMPVYGGRFPALAIERFAQLQGDNTPCGLVAVYGNRAIDDALIDLSDVAQAHGFLPVAGVEAVAKHSLFPTVAADRPDADDRAQLAEMGCQIAAAAQSPALAEMPGKRPYKPRKPNKIFPQLDTSQCTGCGLCVQSCPAGAIDSTDLSHIDPDKCIACMRCVTLCPTGARIRPPEMMASMWTRLEPVFSGHKPNTIYLAR